MSSTKIGKWIRTNFPDLKPAPPCPVCDQPGKRLWVETQPGLSGPGPVRPGKVECETAECPAYRVEIRQ
jgi:hypothetical protein